MKPLSLSQEIMDYDGNVIKLGDGRPVTFQRVFISALNEPKQNQKPDEKLDLYLLTKKIASNTEVELTLEDRVIIKKYVGEMYNPLVYGRTCELLENIQ